MPQYFYKLKEGKLPLNLLKKYLKFLTEFPKEIRIRPGPGADAAVVETKENYLVISQDPITFTEREIGYYSVIVNANDIAVMGAKPLYYLWTLLLPNGISRKKIEEIFKEVQRTCSKYRISVIGGHTEITPYLSRSIISGCIIGTREKKKGVFPKEVEPQDYILCIKEVPIEGISIIAKEKEKELKGIVEEKLLNRFKNYHKIPGISIVKEALFLSEIEGVLAMHDPTEGGIINGIYEFSEFLKLGSIIYEREIPVIKGGEKIFEKFKIDPLKTISSGSLLVAVKRKRIKNIEKILQKKNISFKIIGKWTEKKDGKKIVLKTGKKRDIFPCQDEISRIF